MTGVTILDTDPKTNVLAFDLRDILAVLGADAARSRWSVQDVECLGADAADALHEASDRHEVLDGARLADLAQRVDQVIEGQFSGRLPDDETDWIVIRAVDSSAYDVLTDRADVLAQLRARFRRVEDLP